MIYWIFLWVLTLLTKEPGKHLLEGKNRQKQTLINGQIINTNISLTIIEVPNKIHRSIELIFAECYFLGLTTWNLSIAAASEQKDKSETSKSNDMAKT